MNNISEGKITVGETFVLKKYKLNETLPFEVIVVENGNVKKVFTDEDDIKRYFKDGTH